MSTFPRIDPDHPLCIAERALDQEAKEEQGVVNVISRRFGDTLSMGELTYLAEQRALRIAGALAHGEDAFEGGAMKPAVVRKILGSHWWNENKAILMSMYMDGVLVGWEARGIAPW